MRLMRENESLIFSELKPVLDIKVLCFMSFLIILFIFKLIKIMKRHKSIILKGSRISESGSIKFLKKLNIESSNVFENLKKGISKKINVIKINKNVKIKNFIDFKKLSLLVLIIIQITKNFYCYVFTF